MGECARKKARANSCVEDAVGQALSPQSHGRALARQPGLQRLGIQQHERAPVRQFHHLAQVLARAVPGAFLVVVEVDATGDFALDRGGESAWQYGAGFTRCLPLARRAGGEGAGPLWGRAAVLATLEAAGVRDVTVHASPDGHAVFAARV